jgi:hypothetical protein
MSVAAPAGLEIRAVEPPPEIDVAVLGPVEIRGAAQPFHRSAAKELVVYLAFHRQGVRNDVWAAALWTDRCMRPPPSTRRPRWPGDRWAGRGAVWTICPAADAGCAWRTRWDRRGAVRPGRGRPRSGRWKDALRLVRGRLFDGLGLCDWAVLDGTQAQVESMVVDTALKAAAHFCAAAGARRPNG